MSVSSSYSSEEIFGDAYLAQASSNIARCRTFIEPVDSLGFSPETWKDLTARAAPGQLKRRRS
jgi:hypothetical protein